LKKSQVIQGKTVSVSHHSLRAKIGFQAAITSIGTIPKSSSPGKINHKEFCTKNTSSSSYFGQVNLIFCFFIIFSRFSL
jgi:hypothetical protein